MTGREGGGEETDLYRKEFRHVLTAAHCVQQDTSSGDIEYMFDDITVTLGKYHLHLILDLISSWTVKVNMMCLRSMRR